MIKYIFLLAYMSTIPLANFMISNVGTFCVPDGPCLIPLGFGIMAPSGVLMIGLALFLRDVIYEKFGYQWTLGAILVGSVLSYLLADPFVAIASITAFLISELSDFFVYSKVRDKSKPLAILASGSVGSVLDSVIFLWIAFGSLAHIEGQIIGKILITLVAAIIIKFYGKKILDG
jgi:uncharacterized PurR-regulated membrane protein YhhQ (DUF165 family)